jgi:hypothetical protein
MLFMNIIIYMYVRINVHMFIYRDLMGEINKYIF